MNPKKVNEKLPSDWLCQFLRLTTKLIQSTEAACKLVTAKRSCEERQAPRFLKAVKNKITAYGIDLLCVKYFKKYEMLKCIHLKLHQHFCFEVRL